MDSLLQLQIIGALAALIFTYKLLKVICRSPMTDGMEAPEPPGAWPIIGHLHLLGGQDPIARTLGVMTDKYGPILKLRLGVHTGLVVSNWELAKECFTTNDRVLASRPMGAAGKYLGYNYAIFGLAPHGPYWSEVRKIVLRELLSNQSLEKLKHVRISEINTCLKNLFSLNNGNTPIKVDMKQWFERPMFNVVTMMIAGKRYFSMENDNEAMNFRKVATEFMYLTGVFVVSDALPYLEWLDLQGHVSAMKRTAKELDIHVGKWLEEHRRAKLLGETKNEDDFVDVLLTILPEDLKDNQTYIHDRDTIIKATALALFLAASDTTAITLTWALSLILNNPDVLKRAQDELDKHVGKEKLVKESDIINLVYLQAIIKETLRLYPAAPLLLPHEAMEDCTVGGYHVPKGTRIFVNIWKLQRDPRVWFDPNEFRPERFLTTHANVDFKGQHFEYIPFSSGRRVCPGITFSTQIMHLTLAHLLHEFNIVTPTKSNAGVDMTESLGITMPKATPLEVLLTPRLPSNLYNQYRD